MTVRMIQYIRNNKRQKIGVLVAVRSYNDISIGWSLCNKKDKFNKERGLEIAIGRARRLTFLKIPPSIKKDVKAFARRCRLYFKNSEIITTFYYSENEIDKNENITMFCFPEKDNGK